jgi:peroxiredoxin
VWPALHADGVALFAISYDSVEILRAFAEKHTITFPLLSDEGSHVIRRLGMINERVQDDHAHYGIKPDPRHVNLPYPGVFVLDEHGVVTHKRFHESYRVRDTGASLIAETLGQRRAEHVPGATRKTEAVSVHAWLDSATYVFFQRLHVNVEVTVEPGFHVYGHPVPDGLVPLAMTVAPIENVEVGAARWPAPHPVRVDGPEEELWAYDGTVHGSLPLTFTGAPGAGDHVVQVTVSYQACSDSTCLVPTSVFLELPVKEIALVGRELPTPPSAKRR